MIFLKVLKFYENFDFLKKKLKFLNILKIFEIFLFFENFEL